MKEYKISENLINAHKQFRKIYEKEIYSVCRKMHMNFDDLGSIERMLIMDEAEKIVKEEIWKYYKQHE